MGSILGLEPGQSRWLHFAQVVPQKINGVKDHVLSFTPFVDGVLSLQKLTSMSA